jgi:hypothetical protein
MAAVMYSLVGEQPLPNLLPIRFLAPAATVLVHTDRTERVSKRLSKLLPATQLLKVDPYDIAQIEKLILDGISASQIDPAAITFNLTGGTKSMAIATYRVAERMRCRFVYFQTEGRQSLLHAYTWTAEAQPVLEQQDEIPGIISIEDYVRAHIGEYHAEGRSRAEGGLFEQQVADLLRSHVDEVVLGVKLGGALDADIMIRKGNRVAVIEAKTGNKAARKEGIDQLNSIAGPDYLGTYTEKFLAIDRQWDKTHSNLRELAEARNITVLEIPAGIAMDEAGQERIQALVEVVMGKL